MKHRLHTLAAVVAALATAPAFAVSTASANLGPIVFTLIDLNPVDGVGPSISFLGDGNGYGNYVTASTYNNFTGSSDGQWLYGASAFSTVTANALATPNASATASIGGNGTLGGATLSASGMAEGTTGQSSAPYYSYLSSSYSATAQAPYYYQSFQLSANTAVVFHIAATVSAAATGVYDPSQSYAPESAWANVSLSIGGPGAGGSGSQSVTDNLSSSASSYDQLVYDSQCGYGYCYVGSSKTKTAELSGSFINLTGGNLQGNLSLSASVNGYSYATVSAVPEPGTWALMLGGLWAVGAVARRRSR